MAAKIKFPARATSTSRGWVTLSVTFTIGAAGAVTSATGDVPTASVVQTGSEDGRYTLTLDRTYRAVRMGGAPGMVGPTDAAFPTTTGSDPQYRNVTTSSFEVQFKRTDTQADTDPASGTVCHWIAMVKEQ